MTRPSFGRDAWQREESATTQEPTESHAGDRVDHVGLVASGLCAAHCALSALLPVALGTLGLGALFGHEAEWVFTLVAVVFASAALVLGWRRHRSVLAASLLALGIAGLLASRGLEMRGPHHGHDDHDEHHHHAVIAHDAHSPEAAHHEPDPSVLEDDHLVAAAVGVAAGLLLLLGHALNLQAGRRPKARP